MNQYKPQPPPHESSQRHFGNYDGCLWGHNQRRGIIDPSASFIMTPLCLNQDLQDCKIARILKISFNLLTAALQITLTIVNQYEQPPPHESSQRHFGNYDGCLWGHNQRRGIIDPSASFIMTPLCLNQDLQDCKIARILKLSFNLLTAPLQITLTIVNHYKPQPPPHESSQRHFGNYDGCLWGHNQRRGIIDPSASFIMTPLCLNQDLQDCKIARILKLSFNLLTAPLQITLTIVNHYKPQPPPHESSQRHFGNYDGCLWGHNQRRGIIDPSASFIMTPLCLNQDLQDYKIASSCSLKQPCSCYEFVSLNSE